MVWTLVEPGVAIIAASLVTIRPLLRQMRFKGFESTERSRSRGFLGRYGRAPGGASKLEENKQKPKRSRAASGMEAAFERSDIGLDDLEAGHRVPEVKTAATRSRALPSRNTTMTSQSSIGGESVVKKTGVRNFSTPLGVVAVRQEANEAVDGDDDDIPPYPEGDLRKNEHEHGVTTLRGHLQNGKTIWRSETLSSPEEAEEIQGLRGVVLRADYSEPSFPRASN